MMEPLMSQDPETLTDALQKLNGRALSSIEFVQDYLQLRFDGPILTAYTPPTVSSPHGTFELGKAGYRDAICEQIGLQIIRTECDSQSVSLAFENGVTICVSLRESDYLGPEALVFKFDEKRIWVV